MPYDVLSFKLEETDPVLVDEVRGSDPLYELEDAHKNYVRSELMDWGPDQVFLESDHQRRDPALSKGILNLRFNGDRGSYPDLPRHSEMFFGFTGNDPRGSTNDPRFDQVRGQVTARAANLQVRMGNNDDNHLTERPWTNQSLSYGMKEIMRRQKRNWRVFSTQKEGRPWGQNVVANEYAIARGRAALNAGANEGLPSEAERFRTGDHGGTAGDVAMRGTGAPRGDGAPWRHVGHEADLGVQKFGLQRGAGRSLLGPGGMGGARLGHARPDQGWASSWAGAGGNRRTLGATMARAARLAGVRGAVATQHDPGMSREAGPVGRGLAPARAVAAAHYAQREEQERPPGPAEDTGAPHGAGLVPGEAPQKARRAAAVEARGQDYLADVHAMVAGLHAGTAADLRRAAGQTRADGTRAHATAENEVTSRRTAMPAADVAQVARLAQIPLTRAAAAEGREVHVYGYALSRPEAGATHGRRAYDDATWRGHREAPALGKSQEPGLWRSATMGQTTLGDAQGMFYHEAELSEDTAHSGVAAGPKSLRAGGWSDGAGLGDAPGQDVESRGRGARPGARTAPVRVGSRRDRGGLADGLG